MAKKKKNGPKGYEDETTQIIRKEFDNSVRGVRRFWTEQDGTSLSQEWDLSGPVLKRRKSSILTFLPKVAERYQSLYEDPKDMKQDFVCLCANAGTSPVDVMGGESFPDVACALWILDVLHKVNKLKEAFAYFPPDPTPAEDIQLPLAEYLPYDELLVQEMTLLVRERDADPEGLKVWITDSAAKRKKPVVYETVDKPPEEMTPRERFNAVMILLPPVYLERAVQRFWEKTWEFLDLYFSVSSFHANRQKKLGLELTRALEEMTDRMQAREGKNQDPHQPEGTIPIVLKSKPGMTQNLGGIVPTVTYEIGQFAQLRRIILDRGEEITQCEKCRIYLANRSFSIHTSDLVLTDDPIPEEDLDKFRAFTVDDPYETCIAYLLLLDQGSDLIWTYNVPRGPLCAAIEKLPWTIPEELYWDDEDEDEEEEDEEEEDESRALSDPDLTEEQVRLRIEELERKRQEYLTQDDNEAYKRLYQMAYPVTIVRDEERVPGEKINLPQLLYELSVGVMPRTCWDNESQTDIISSQGVPREEAAMLALLCQILEDAGDPVVDWEHYLRSGKFRAIFNQYGPREGMFPDPPEGVEETEGEPGSEDDPESLHEALKQEREICRKLRSELHEARKEVQRLEESAREQEKETQAERSELADLRELVFLQANDQNAGAGPEESPVEFPFETRRRVVVFGGYDSWLKSIRPMLPNVTFAAHQYPNADLMRYADEIWLQPNSMAHKQFYKIINTVRTYHIPIRYFSCASARKCAIEFAESEPGESL